MLACQNRTKPITKPSCSKPQSSHAATCTTPQGTHSCQRVNNVVQLGSPGEVVVPKHTWDARVGQDVGIASPNTIRREWPVLLRAVSVVIRYECYCAGWPPAHQPRRFAIAVPQPPQLILLDGLLHSWRAASARNLCDVGCLAAMHVELSLIRRHSMPAAVCPPAWPVRCVLKLYM